MKQIVFMLFLAPVMVLAHGTVADQMEAVTKRVMKAFSESQSTETNNINDFVIKKTGDEMYLATVKIAKKDFVYKCGMGAAEKDKWGCKLQ